VSGGREALADAGVLARGIAASTAIAKNLATCLLLCRTIIESLLVADRSKIVHETPEFTM
jgi:hypothetical protein